MKFLTFFNMKSPSLVTCIAKHQSERPTNKVLEESIKCYLCQLQWVTRPAIPTQKCKRSTFRSCLLLLVWTPSKNTEILMCFMYILNCSNLWREVGKFSTSTMQCVALGSVHNGMQRVRKALEIYIFTHHTSVRQLFNVSDKNYKL